MDNSDIIIMHVSLIIGKIRISYVMLCNLSYIYRYIYTLLLSSYLTHIGPYILTHVGLQVGRRIIKTHPSLRYMLLKQ